MSGTGQLWKVLQLAALLCPHAACPACVDVADEVGRRTDVSQGPVSREMLLDMLSAPDDAAEPQVDGRGSESVETSPGEGGREAREVMAEAVAEDVGADAPGAADSGGEHDVCTPACEDLECGMDGCGGVCGVCPASKPVCSFGKCKKCSPDCGIHECGPDGCGGVCGECAPMFACSGGFCVAPSCVADGEVLFEETFDSCMQGAFEIVDFQPDDDVTWWALPMEGAADDCCLYLGDPVTQSYDTGSAVHVKLISPLLQLPNGGSWRVSFSLFMNADPVPHPLYPYDFDVLFLHFAAADGTVLSSLWSSKETLNDTLGETIIVSLDLTLLEGHLGRFVFDFDTIDSLGNDYAGIRLDDFRVEKVCPYCLEDSDCEDDDPCTLESCLMFTNEPEVGSCTHEPIAGCEVGPPPDEGEGS